MYHVDPPSTPDQIVNNALYRPDGMISKHPSRDPEPAIDVPNDYFTSVWIWN